MAGATGQMDLASSAATHGISQSLEPGRWGPVAVQAVEPIGLGVTMFYEWFTKGHMEGVVQQDGASSYPRVVGPWGKIPGTATCSHVVAVQVDVPIAGGGRHV